MVWSCAAIATICVSRVGAEMRMSSEVSSDLFIGVDVVSLGLDHPLVVV